MVSTKAPSSHVTLAILPTMAPPHSAGRPLTTFGLTLRAKSAILGDGRVDLGALEKHLPGIFVRCVEEPGQSLVLGRVEFPQIKSPSLTREDPAEEHDLDYVTSLTFLSIRSLTRVWSPVTSAELPHDRPVSFHEVSRVGMPDRNSGAAAHSGSRGSMM